MRTSHISPTTVTPQAPQPMSNPEDGASGRPREQDAETWPEEMALPEQLNSEAVRSLHARIDREWGPLLRTACQTAAGRALWKHATDDPVAAVLAGESCLRSLYGKMRKDKLSNAREVSGVILAVRTLWFDSKIEAAVRNPDHAGGPQIVLLGAGMDARAYRLLCLKECAVFEVDFEELLQVKAALLEEATGRVDGQTLKAKSLVRVAADVREDDWLEKLQGSGFSPRKSAIWVLEGLLYYLTHVEATRVLRSVAANASTASTVLIADFMNEASASLCRDTFQFHCDWPERLLESMGFPDVRLSQIGDPDARFGLLDDQRNLLDKIRRLPRSTQADPEDGTPCRRLFMVEASGSPDGKAS